jgi:hypothetical protein
MDAIIRYKDSDNYIYIKHTKEIQVIMYSKNIKIIR